jgi:prepilin-type N-terminal cleavage/methylation domain-containing protein
VIAQGIDAPRRGFTLWETALVLAVLSVTLVLAAPALVGFGTNKPQSDAEGLLALLRDARRAAVQTSTVVAVRLDPTTGRYRTDTTGVYGMGQYGSGTLDLGGATLLVTDLARLQFLFQPTGAAFADSVGVRGPGGTVMVWVDPWSGVPHADAR